MKKTTTLLTIILSLVLPFMGIHAQVITTTPALPTASDSVTLTFNATLCGGGMAGYSGDVYAHTGVTIDANQWQYVIGQWGNNHTQPKLTRIGTDLYELKIKPSIREFYNAPENANITQMCFVFRGSSGSPQTEDLFVDVVEEGLNVSISNPVWSHPFYSYGSTLTIDAQANNSDNITIYVNNVEVASTTDETITHQYEIDEYGKQWVKAVATSGDEIAADSVYFYVRGDSPVAVLPEGLIPGINITGESEVTLVLHDPPALKEFVFAIGDFNQWELDDAYNMNRTPDGTHYWLTISGLNPNLEYIYQYWVDGELKLADPYCNKISDPWNDKWISETNYPNLIPYPEGKTTGVTSVFRVNPDPFEWQSEDFLPPANEDLIIYEMHIRDFVAGDYIISALEKLDYLKTLGINAIELMPINEFEGNDSWGYNPSFYFAPDKAYGTPNDYKLFIDECHKRGMAVIIDMVLNHTFGLSPMVQMYFDPNAGEWGLPTADNPWYNETCPHPPWCWGYDFNHESIHTKNFIDRVAKYWLTEFKVDGFRFDFTKGFTNINTGGEGWNYNSQRVAILKRYADYIWSVNPKAYVILEHFTANDEEKELAEYKSGEGKGMMLWGNINHTYNEASMGWLNDSNFDWVSYKKRGWSTPNLIGYMESHDEERLMYKNITYGNSTNPDHDIKNLGIALKRQKLVGTFFFTIPGPKMIWQFGELGYDVSIEYNGRVGRKPIRWNYYDVLERRSLYNTWAELIALRKGLPVFSTDNFSLSLNGAGKTIILRHNDMDVVIVGNFDVTGKDINVTFPSSGKWYEYFTQSEVNFETAAQTFTMQPGEYRLYSTVYINRDDYAVGISENTIDGNQGHVNVWPNPFDDHLEILVNTDALEPYSMKLMDVSGRLLATVAKGTLTPGANSVFWRRNINLPKGVYILSVQTASWQQAVRVCQY